MPQSSAYLDTASRPCAKMNSGKGEGQHVLLLPTGILDRVWAANFRGVVRTLSLSLWLRNVRQLVHLPAALGTRFECPGGFSRIAG